MNILIVRIMIEILIRKDSVRIKYCSKSFLIKVILKTMCVTWLQPKRSNIKEAF